MSSGLCKMCPYRVWYPSDDDEFPSDNELHWKGWHWCPKQKDYIHDSWGCYVRELELKPKRIPLEVRCGLKPNEQGEYIV